VAKFMPITLRKPALASPGQWPIHFLYSAHCTKLSRTVSGTIRARHQEALTTTARLGDLDDPDYPAYTTGRAAEVLGVQQAFLRALDTAGAVTPQRTAGGRRRYSRRQLVFAARIRKLFDQNHTLAAALRILALEDDLASERALTARLHEQLAGQDLQDER
jgi:MerR family transcriptional regulator/heat shock protein HspR